TLDYEILGPFAPDVTIRLEDKQTGACHAVLSDLPIAFSLPASADTTSRFRMVFSTPLKVATLQNPCPGGRSGQVAIADPGNPSWSYHLHNGAGTLVGQSTQVDEQDTIMGLADGAYTLTAFGSCGSADTLSFELREGNGPELSATVSPSICGASQDGWIDLTVERAHPPYSYQWSHGDTVQDPADIGGGRYTVTVTDRFQCRDSLAVTLDEREPIVANFRTADNTTQYYTGDTVHFINISEGAQAYRWDFGDGHQSADENPSHVFEGTGDYPVSLTAYYDDCAPDVREHWLRLQEKLTTSIAPSPGTRPPFHIAQRGQQLLLSGNAHQRERVQVTIHDLSGRQLFHEEITLLPGEPSALSVTPRTGQILLLHVSSSTHSKTERYAFH
ncbi:MAG: PKD domain-containing protein, partial [Bacteroidota bacterium]